MRNEKMPIPDTRPATVIGIIAVIAVIIYCIATSGNKTEFEENKSSTAAADAPAPGMTRTDTLRKSEIRAMVFLEQEFGLKRADIDMTEQEWYPAQRMEVAKWRLRNGMSHMYVVTQTKLIGGDIHSFDAYNTWDVKVVNKFSE